MQKTTQCNIDSNTAAVNTAGLMKILCCGRETAIKIGKAAQAKIQIDKRVLWYLPKIHHYLEQITK